MKTTRYRIEYGPEAVDHLKALTGGERGAVVNAVDRQLIHAPNVPTRNRKPNRANKVARFELRIGKLRVYYDVKGGDPEPMVLIKAIGVKDRDVVRIGGEEIEL